MFASVFYTQNAHAQTPDTIKTPVVAQPRRLYVDSAELQDERDQFVSDSLNKAFVSPRANRPNLFVDSILQHDAGIFKSGEYFLKGEPQIKSNLKYGRSRPFRDQWIIAITVGLLLYMGILKLFVGKDIDNVLLSFYSRRVLSQTSKEESFMSTWAFLGLFLLFGLTFGLFLYEASAARGHYFTLGGMQLFVFLSVVILAIFAVKFLVLKFIGFVFNIDKPVAEYLSVLHLTYFNIAFVFLAICTCFSLIDVKYTPYLIYITVALIVVIFIWQYLRSSVDLISNFRFRKIYLFIYLCALEICPVLILIKALNI